MFLCQLSFRGSSLLFHRGSAVGRAGCRGTAAISYQQHPHLHLLQPPAPPPCWSSRGPPSWPPCSRPAASQLPSARVPHPQGFNPSCRPRGLRSVFTCACRPMEQAYRGPPHKKRKSTQDKDKTKEGTACGSSMIEPERRAAGEPPPPGTPPPVGKLETQPVQCKVTAEGF